MWLDSELTCVSLNPLRYNKIHVSAERLAMYRYLPDMTPYFTTDGQYTKIHACKWQVWTEGVQDWYSPRFSVKNSDTMLSQPL